MEVVLFTYNRPHWKTERFLHELMRRGFTPSLVAAAPWKTLKIPETAVLSVRHLPRHPAVLCHDLGIPFLVVPHEDVGGGDLGVVGGARLLPKKLIEKFPLGILNIHPGCLRRNRGLSNIARAMRDGIPQMVSAHLINEQIDAGRLIDSAVVPVEADDSIYDLGEKMMDMQTDLVGRAVRMALGGKRGEAVDSRFGYEPPLDPATEWEIIREWEMRE